MFMKPSGMIGKAAPRMGGFTVAGPRLAQGPSYIDFRVRDARTDMGIPNATITITHGARTRTWTTDDTGYLELSIAVNAGDLITVTAEAPGYEPQTLSNVVSMPMAGMGTKIFDLGPAAGVSTELLVGGGLAALFVGALLFS